MSHNDKMCHGLSRKLCRESVSNLEGYRYAHTAYVRKRSSAETYVESGEPVEYGWDDKFKLQESVRDLVSPKTVLDPRVYFSHTTEET